MIESLVVTAIGGVLIFGLLLQLVWPWLMTPLADAVLDWIDTRVPADRLAAWLIPAGALWWIVGPGLAAGFDLAPALWIFGELLAVAVYAAVLGAFLPAWEDDPVSAGAHRVFVIGFSLGCFALSAFGLWIATTFIGGG